MKQTLYARLLGAALLLIQAAGRRVERELAAAKVRQGDPTLCPVTLEPHLLVTFHSAINEERFQCLDCEAFFRSKENLLTRPHGRSRIGND